MSRLAKQIEAYRMARRIVRACNRMKAGQGVALQWCTQQRHVLHWMSQRVAMGLRKRKTIFVDYGREGGDCTAWARVHRVHDELQIEVMHRD